MYASSASWVSCFTPVYCAALLVHTTVSLCSCWQSSPESGSGATAWKVSSSEWKTIAQHCFHSKYQPTEIPHQLSSGTFFHAEEGFYLAAELRSFRLCVAGYSLRWSGRERAWLTICSKQKKEEWVYTSVSFISHRAEEITWAVSRRMKSLNHLQGN